MENEVFERDYSQLMPLHLTSLFQNELEIVKQAVNSGIIREYEEAVRAMPKVIVPGKKAIYDDLLVRLDEFARVARGSIRGVVDYEEWNATITLNVHKLLFEEPFGTLLMADISLSSESLTITADTQGKLQMIIEMPYFQDIGNKEQVMDDLLEKDDSILEMIANLFCGKNDADTGAEDEVGQ